MKTMMEHNEAMQQMAAERYLLNELTPEDRDAFEEHLFVCPDCALDLRAGVAFVTEAKAQLPDLTRATPAPAPFRSSQSNVKRGWRFTWLQPAFAAPVFATLLMVIGYQNLVTYPRLRAAADQPRLLPWTPLHGATRGAAHMIIDADRRHGVVLPIDLPEQTSTGAYTTYGVDLNDPQGKMVWTGASFAPSDDGSGGQRLSLMIPGAILRSGTYTIMISGIAADGNRVKIDQYAFDLRVTD